MSTAFIVTIGEGRERDRERDGERERERDDKREITSHHNKM